MFQLRIGDWWFNDAPMIGDRKKVLAAAAQRPDRGAQKIEVVPLADERYAAVLSRWYRRLEAERGKRGVVASRAAYGIASERVARLQRREAAELKSLILGHEGRVREYKAAEAARTSFKRIAHALCNKVGLKIAEKAGMAFDEHGGYNASRGDYRHTTCLDCLLPRVASRYLATPGTGLALIEVARERRYSKSYHKNFGPSCARDRYLVGENEAGTGFAHPVPKTTVSVASAMAWIWRGYDGALVVRQGDIAIVRGNGGPRMPKSLPDAHKVIDGVGVVHPTHPTIRLPQKGERLIVGRRAAVAATSGTRD